MTAFMVSLNLFWKRDSRQELYENLKRQLKIETGSTGAVWTTYRFFRERRHGNVFDERGILS